MLYKGPLKHRDGASPNHPKPETIPDDVDTQLPIIPAGESTPISQISYGNPMFDHHATQHVEYTFHQVVTSSE